MALQIQEVNTSGEANMKYIISGRDVRISEVAEDETVIRSRAAAKAK